MGWFRNRGSGINVLTFFPLTGGCSEGLDASSFFSKYTFRINLELVHEYCNKKVSTVQFSTVVCIIFISKRGPKSYFLNHLTDSARRRLKPKLLCICDHVKKKKKCTMFQSRVKGLSKTVQMVSTVVARNRFVS